MNKELFDCLLEIQETIKVEKTHDNAFGGYKYRSLPDIVATAKPIANKHNCVIITKDNLVHEGDRYYICAEAVLLHSSGEQISATALARESQQRPKMDDPQLTGSSSTYARKYAYNGLFAIDDSKDSDAINNNLAYTQHMQKPIEQNISETNIIAEGAKLVSNCKSREEIINIYNDPKFACVKQNNAWITIVQKQAEKFKK